MTTQAEMSTGNLKTAIKHAMELLSAGESGLAREQAEEILRQFPDEMNSQFVVAAAIRAQGHEEESLQRLKTLTEKAPDFALAQQELGFAYAATGNLMAGIQAFQAAVKIQPKLPASWMQMGELFLVDGDEVSANEAFRQHLLTSNEDPDLVNAVDLFRAGKLAQSERLCRGVLDENPTNITAIRLLAEIGIKIGVYADAENLLRRCLELAPDFRLARLNFANVLSKREKLEEALVEIDRLLEEDPEKPAYFAQRAAILVRMGDFERALPCYDYLLSHFPAQAKIVLSNGHALKTVGKLDEAIAAYRRAIELRPTFGDGYWSLANLKTFRFDDADIDAMRAAIDDSASSREDHFHLCFALGKAFDDRKEFDEAFRYYQMGNHIKEKLEGYDAKTSESITASIRTVCGATLFKNQAGKGCPAPDPIFIVGLPRSGSTLLEQILASHSQVDGTKELVHILSFVRRLGGRKKTSEKSRYPEVLKQLSAEQLTELGQEYLDRSRIQRQSAPYFIDKMPNNFFHVGLINLILPNARIIDARRHPMAACFSGYTQLFARGQPFTYSLADVGRYYCDYVNMMDHWDEVLPDKVLRVQYEDVVSDTEAQVRRMLDYCGLPFEESCLQFHQTERAVRTASSEQVRQPIYNAALEHWRNYEAHLDTLKASLAPVLDRYPLE
ncbi:MAG: sulfotransferase [Proteobacteria bacterium]|nr:sulfotransferase [Pseudomonadota bacterium]